MLLIRHLDTEWVIVVTVDLVTCATKFEQKCTRDMRQEKCSTDFLCRMGASRVRYRWAWAVPPACLEIPERTQQRSIEVCQPSCFIFQRTRSKTKAGNLLNNQSCHFRTLCAVQQERKYKILHSGILLIGEYEFECRGKKFTHLEKRACHEMARYACLLEFFYVRVFACFR